MKNYDEDSAKENSRQLVGSVLDRTLLSFRKPEEIRVLHLPGRNGQEYKSIYQPRGIPAENVVGIDRDPDDAKEAQRNNPGTRVICTTLESFLERTPELDYDVMSIDLTGNLSVSNLAILEQFAIRNKKKHFLYHFAVSARREGELAKELLLNMAKYQCFRDRHDLHRPLDPVSQDIEAHRDCGMEAVATAFSKASHDQFLNIAYRLTEREVRAHVGKLRAAHEVLGGLTDAEIVETASGTIEAVVLGALFERFRLYSMANSFPGGKLFFPQLHAQDASRALDQISDINAKDVSFLASRTLEVLFRIEIGTFYLIEDYAKYSYVSESGAPMIGDVMYARNYPALLDHAHEAMRQLNSSSPFVKNMPVLFRALRKINNAHLGSAEHLQESPRVYLGSSAKPILRRKEAIELLKSGRTPEELESTYRGMGLGRLRAYQAHVTMGTYGPDARRARVVELDERARDTLRQDIDVQRTLHDAGSAGDVGTLSKEDALAYLSAGISPKEICGAYPSTKMAKLVAWQFWMNRGKYNAE